MMKKLYRIFNIVHSGRKGIRLTPVSDPKYHSLIGTVCQISIDALKQFEQYTFKLYNHPYYDTWTISEVIAVGTIRDSGMLYIETCNSIYFFEPLEEQYGQAETPRINDNRAELHSEVCIM